MKLSLFRFPNKINERYEYNQNKELDIQMFHLHLNEMTK